MDDQTFLNHLAEKLSKLGTVRPLGFHYLHPYGTAPADSIICNGATYSRALYKDFFDYITNQGWVKTEAEWQEIAKRSNGFCPFYSSGDGSTNFRTPKFAPYQQIAMCVTQATTYHQAGLPDVSGTLPIPGDTEKSARALLTGAFEFVDMEGIRVSNAADSTADANARFKASLYCEIYGRSTTVTPESHEWVMCVVVYGVATNVGSVDIQNVMTAVNAVQAKVAKLDGVKSVVVETWKGSNGANWYRKWSDGFIEQGGHSVGKSTQNKILTVTLPIAYKDTEYTIAITGVNPTNFWGYAAIKEGSVTSTSFDYSGMGNTNSDGIASAYWYTCGY